VEVLVLPVREMLVERGQSEAPIRRLPAVAAVEREKLELVYIPRVEEMALSLVFWEHLIILQAVAVAGLGSHPLRSQEMADSVVVEVEEKLYQELLDLVVVKH
jgi:hypothetical protein